MKTRKVKLRLSNEQMEWLTDYKETENFKNYSDVVNFFIVQCYETVIEVELGEYANEELNQC